MINVVYMIVAFIAIYYIAVRPINKQNKEHKKILESLEIGDIILTSGGIIGKIICINERTINISSLGSEIKIDKHSVIKTEKEE